MARAEQVVGLLLVEPDRAADVRADLGVGHDPVDRPVPLASGRWISSGSSRITIVVALARSLSGCGISSTPSGCTWITPPIGTSAALIGRPVGSVTSRLPGRQAVSVEAGAGQRAEVAQRDDREQPERRQGAEQAVADQLAAAEAGARGALLEGRDGLRAVLVAGAHRLALLTISSSGIRVLAQWMAPDADAEQREPEAEAEQLGRQADLLEHLVARGVGRLDREVGDDEQQRAQRGEAEEGGDLALAALRGLGVDVGAPVDVRRQAGVAVAGRPARRRGRPRSRRRCRRPAPVPTVPSLPVSVADAACPARRGCGLPSLDRGPRERVAGAMSLIAPSPPARRRRR